MASSKIKVKASLEAGGRRKLMRSVRSVEKQYVEELQGLVMRTARLIERAAKVNLESDPRRIDTRRLRRSIQVALLKSGFHYLTARIGTDVPYSVYVHEGTGVYERHGEGRKTPWVYFDERREQYVVTKGMRPNTFLLDAWKDHIDNFKRDLRKISAKT